MGSSIVQKNVGEAILTVFDAFSTEVLVWFSSGESKKLPILWVNFYLLCMSMIMTSYISNL